MKVRSTGFISLISIVLLMVFAGQTLAGGLVDTSYETWQETEFNKDPTDLSRNPWWDPSAGPVLYFADGEDGCEWNLVENAGFLENAFIGGDFTGDYQMDIRVILDREWLDEDVDCEESSPIAGDLKELTYDWYAIDDDDNIWYMGEDTYDSEGSNEGSFVAGCDGAEAGIVMLAEPHKGEFYRQEFYEDEAEDWGKVLKRYSVDGHECIKTKEWTPLESGHVEHKFYCNDEGLLLAINELKGKTVMVEWIGSVDPGDIPAAPVVNPSPIPVCD